MVAVAVELEGQYRREGKPVSVLSKADVVNAYLQAPLPENEKLLFALPDGCEAELTAGPGQKVAARSLKAQMGMKQSGRVWHRHQHKCLLNQGFTTCSSAPCLYVREMPTGFILVGIFVDDLLVINATGDPNAITELWTALGRYYDVKAETKLTKFLGAEYTELPEGLHLHLNQYITNVLARFNMSTCIAEDLPEPAELDLETPESVALLGKTDKKEFQEITGSCMFAMIACRPDIAHATNMLSRRMNKPRVCDARAARHLLRYLQGTKQHGLFFRYEPLPGTRGLEAFSDSDWAQDRDARRSTTGYIVFYNGTPISWHSGLQPVISTSSCEAEYTALADCTREVIYLRNLVYFLHQPVQDPVKIHVDNQGAVDLVNNPVHHRRTKHIEVRYHFARHAQEAGEINVVKIPTADNRADIFTKATTRAVFSRLVAEIMFAPTTSSS
jgi:hypothetical protein